MHSKQVCLLPSIVPETHIVDRPAYCLCTLEILPTGNFGFAIYTALSPSVLKVISMQNQKLTFQKTMLSYTPIELKMTCCKLRVQPAITQNANTIKLVNDICIDVC